MTILGRYLCVFLHNLHIFKTGFYAPAFITVLLPYLILHQSLPNIDSVLYKSRRKIEYEDDDGDNNDGLHLQNFKELCITLLTLFVFLPIDHC